MRLQWSLPKLYAPPAESASPLESRTTESEYHLVIHHPKCPDKVLLTVGQSHSNASLPFVLSEKHGFAFVHEETDHFLLQVKHALCIPFQLSLLSCASYKRILEDPETYDYVVKAIVALEAHGDNLPAPPGMMWAELRQVDALPVYVVPHGESADLFNLIESRESARHLPYAQLGWFDETSSWIRREFRDKSCGVVTHIEQLRFTWRGCVLKIKTEDMSTYFAKCCPKFTKEIEAFNVLLELVPEHLPTPLIVDSEKRIIVTRDVGEFHGTFEIRGPTKKAWAHELFRIHQKTSYNENILLERAGLRRVRVGSIISSLDELLGQAQKFVEEDVSDVIAGIRNLESGIRYDCNTLASLNIPDTFVHMDLMNTNIFLLKDSNFTYGIMDFADSVITHPFIDTMGLGDSRGYTDRWVTYLKQVDPDSVSNLTAHFVWTARPCGYRLCRVVELIRLWYEMQELKMPLPDEIPYLFADLLHGVKLQYERAGPREIPSCIKSQG